jgi:hypothetical protein
LDKCKDNKTQKCNSNFAMVGHHIMLQYQFLINMILEKEFVVIHFTMDLSMNLNDFFIEPNINNHRSK